LRAVAIMAQPVMPGACAKLLDLLGVPDTSRDFSHIGVKGRLDGGRVMPAPSGLFPRYVEEDTSAQDTKA